MELTEVAMGQCLLRVLQSFPISPIPQWLHDHSFIHHRQYYNFSN